MWTSVLLRRARSRSRSTSNAIFLARYISSTPILHKEENLQQAYADLIRYFTFTRDLEYARKLHTKIFDRGFGKDRYLLNLIVEMYGKCGSFAEAKDVFDQMPARDQMSWTAMVTAGAESGDEHYDQGLGYYRYMLLEGGMVPDSVLLSSALCCVETLPEARKIHDQVETSGYIVDPGVVTSLIHAYRRCDRLDLAREVFDLVELKDMALWTSMLLAHSHSEDDAEDGLRIFWRMELEGIRPDRETFLGLIIASANAMCRCNAKLVDERIRAHGVERDQRIASAMLHMHGKCGNLEESKEFFGIAEKKPSNWNLMIASCSYHGHGADALALQRTMSLEGLEMDSVTFASAIDACADLRDSRAGEDLHDRVLAAGLQRDEPVASALVNLYGKCNKVEVAERIFEECWKTLASWNFMLAAYAQNGHFGATMETFVGMCHQGVVPDELTLLVLVAGCGQAGKVDTGRDVFRLFQDEMQMELLPEHYSCVVDMLGRNGKLAEAEELIENMPYYPDFLAWSAMLRSCTKAKDVKRGARMAEAALESYLEKSTPHKMLKELASEVENSEKNQSGDAADSNGVSEYLQPRVVCACGKL